MAQKEFKVAVALDWAKIDPIKAAIEQADSCAARGRMFIDQGTPAQAVDSFDAIRKHLLDLGNLVVDATQTRSAPATLPEAIPIPNVKSGVEECAAQAAAFEMPDDGKEPFDLVAMIGGYASDGGCGLVVDLAWLDTAIEVLCGRHGRTAMVSIPKPDTPPSASEKARFEATIAAFNAEADAGLSKYTPFRGGDDLDSFCVGVVLPVIGDTLDWWNDGEIPERIEVVHRAREVVIRLID